MGIINGIVKFHIEMIKCTSCGKKSMFVSQKIFSLFHFRGEIVDPPLAPASGAESFPIEIQSEQLRPPLMIWVENRHLLGSFFSIG